MAILLVSVLKKKISKMSKIDVSQWQEYKISQLFSVRPSKYVRENGKVVSNRKLLDDGPNPVVVNSSVNNGIGGTTSYEPTEHGNVITYSDTVDGNTIFYQAKPFVGYSHVKVMEPKEKRNPVEMIFLTAVIGRRLSDGNYDYTNKMTTNRVLNTTIKLPALSDGSPDWQYMDEYIAKLATQAHTNISLLRQQQKKAPTVNIDRWKEFKIDNLFEKITTKKLPYKATQLPHHATEDNLIPLVTAGVEHQGRSVYAPKTRDITVLSNCLTISANGANSGATFYQDKPFSILQDAYAIQVKSSINENVSKYEYCFLASVIGKRLQQNDWTNKATWNVVKAKEIRLPVTESDEPDWQYMDKYISSIQQAQKERVARLTSIIK